MSDEVSVDEHESSYAYRMMTKLTLYGGMDDPILGSGQFSNPQADTSNILKEVR